MPTVKKHSRLWYTIEHAGKEFEVQQEPCEYFDPLIETLPDGRIVIGYLSSDNDPQNPRENDNLGVMVCWHRRYKLGDKHRHEDPTALWRELLGADEYDGLVEAAEEQLERWREANPTHSYGSDRYKHEQRQVVGSLEQTVHARVAAKGYVWLPLHLYDHSGITMSTGSFSAYDPGGWDSGQVGVIYMSPEKIAENWPGRKLDDPITDDDDHSTKTLRERVEECLRGEVEEYDHYLTGDAYGVCVHVFDQAGEEIDEHQESCWGYLGREYAEQTLKDEMAGMVRYLADNKKG